MSSNAPIGVFDSGAGGVSILRALVDELPRETFIYLGDSAHAPYGQRSADEILALSREMCARLIAQGAKAVVIACNTATSAAAATLREELPDIPVIGVEPALKPAVCAHEGGCVLVMATPVTLALDKYHELAATYESRARVIPVPCPELAARIEQGNLDAPDVIELVRAYVGEYAGEVDAVVLGCTHYPFVAGVIREVLGDVELFDGAAGTARQLRRVLRRKSLLAEAGKQGSVVFESTLEGAEQLYGELFALA